MGSDIAGNRTEALSEAKRLEVLQRLDILDSESEQIYNDAAVLASQICGTPIALVSLIDSTRQWFKARVGIEIAETSRGLSFCSHAIKSPETMIVEDATQDERFAHNELVTGDFHLRFYAGAPVYADSVAVGTLCVVGHEPRKLNQEQVLSLEALARHVSQILWSRLQAKMLDEQNELIKASLESERELGRLLRHSAERFANLFHGLPIACMTLDTDGCVVEWNRQCTEVYGFEPEEAFMNQVNELIVPADSFELAGASLRATLENGGIYEPTEWHVLRKDKTPIWVITSAVPIHDPSGAIVGLISSNVDITERKAALQALEQSSDLIKLQRDDLSTANLKLALLATKDGLTGTNNHRAFQEFLESSFAYALRHSSELSVIMMDVDSFKSYNDEFGHPAGDEVLKSVAHALNSVARKGDFVARYGGEEFVVVAPGTGLEEGIVAGERYRAAIENVVWPKRNVTVSVGVSSLHADTDMRSSLVAEADSALYAAKHSGRNCVRVFEVLSVAV